MSITNRLDINALLSQYENSDMHPKRLVEDMRRNARVLS